jgi:hypothetical protein
MMRIQLLFDGSVHGMQFQHRTGTAGDLGVLRVAGTSGVRLFADQRATNRGWQIGSPFKTPMYTL